MTLEEASSFVYFKNVVIPRDIKLLDKKKYENLKKTPDFTKKVVKYTIVDVYHYWKNIIVKNQKKVPLTFEIADMLINTFLFIEKELEKIK
jgi:hypothetical protein